MSSETVIFLVALGTFFALLLTNVPISMALIAGAFFGLFLFEGLDLAIDSIASLSFSSTSKYSLVVVPMFILMGMLAMRARISEDVFRFADFAFRRLPGGLGVATVAAAAGFSAVTGSSVATAATVGKTAIREMRSYGYPASLACGIVAAAGTLGVLIPPSIILVIYGIMTGESIGRLLLAGIVPGLLSALVYAIAIIIYARLKIQRTEQENLHPEEVRRIRRNGWSGVMKIGVLFLIVVGGIYLGLITASESGALGAFVALLIVIWLWRRQARELLHELKNAFEDSSSLTSMVFAVVIGASALTYLLVNLRIPQQLTETVLNSGISRHLTLILLLLLFIPLGMFLDSISVLLITIPLTYPIVMAMGFDGIWFAILVVKMVEIGLITPPIGINAYVVAGVADKVPIVQVFRGIWPFVLMDLFIVVVIYLFPAVVLWLPNMGSVV